jgi:toxin YoeB
LNRKRKQKSASGDDEAIQPEIVLLVPVFIPEFKIDLRWWYRYEPKKGDRIMDLVADILDGDPFTGLGKPEPLKYIAANTWSRRIDLEHRLVYQVNDNRIVFLQARYHYED